MFILSDSSPTEIGTRMSWGGRSRELMWRPRRLPSHVARAAPSMATRSASSSGYAPPLAGGLGRMPSSRALSILAVIGNELHQRTIGSAGIHAGAGPFRAEALDRPVLNRGP